MILRILLLAVIIAPLSLAGDFNPDDANTTGAQLSMITAGDVQAADLVSNSPPDWENLSLIASYQDYGRTSLSQAEVDKQLVGIYPFAQVPGLAHHQDLLDILANDAEGSNSPTADQTSDNDIRISSSYLGDRIDPKLLDIYNIMVQESSLIESKYLEEDIRTNQFNAYSYPEDSDSVIKDRIAIDDLNSGESLISYFYEENPKRDVLLAPAKDAAHTIVSNFDRIHGSSDQVTYAPQMEYGKDADTETSEYDYMTQYPSAGAFLSDLPDMKSLEKSWAIESDDLEASGIVANVKAHMERIRQEDTDIYNVINNYDNSLQNKAGSIIPLLDNLNAREVRSHSSKNYAVVVGINSYSDRMSLHNSINDADKMAALLESYGYEVTKLTDHTPDQPTKDNILEKALGGLKKKKDLGKAIIYFSGHGEKKGDDYYLIPQNSNGHISSYISARELEESIRGLKGVALVVDACNSGELEKIADNGQLVLASSDADEPSNEAWFGPLSLFTNNLFNAIREEEKLSSEISLQRCFYKARDATEKWSNPLIAGQTPQMEDKTYRDFYLN